jgi:hypothetical protein
MNKKYNIEDLLRKEFKEFTPEPPDNVWESVFNRLEEESPRKKLIPVWMKVAASIAAILIPTMMVIWFAPINSTQIASTNDEVIISIKEETFINDNPTLEAQAPIEIEEDAGATKANASNNNNIQLTLPEQSNQLAEIIETPTFVENNIKIQSLPEYNFSGINNASDIIITKQELNLSETKINQPLLADNNKSPYKSSVGASISPHYSNNYYLGSMQSTGIPFESLEENLKTFSFSLQYTLQSSSRFSFETGINYFTIGQLVKEILSFGVKYDNLGTNPIDQIPMQSALTSLGEVSFTGNSLYFADIISYRIATEKDSPFGEPVLLDQFDDKISQYLSFIDIPLVVRYSLFDYKNADISIRLGVSGSYLLNNNVYLGAGDFGQIIGETKGINDFSMAGIGGISLNIPITQKLKINIEPTSRVFLTPVSQNNFSGEGHPVSFFINTGLKYQL